MEIAGLFYLLTISQAGVEDGGKTCEDPLLAVEGPPESKEIQMDWYRFFF